MKTINKILIAGGAILAIGSYIAYEKALKVKAIFDQMEIEPYAIKSFDFNLKQSKIRFNLDVLLKNNSVNDLFLTGVSVASLNKILIYYNDAYIGQADVFMNEVFIPGKNSLVVKGIAVEVEAITALQNATSLANFSINNVKIIGIVEALGKLYEIGNE